MRKKNFYNWVTERITFKADLEAEKTQKGVFV